MADAWGGQVNHGTYNWWQGGVSAWVESYPSATTAVIVVQARFHSRYAISSSQFYAYTECSGYGSGENQSTVNSPNADYYVTLREQRFTVNRPQGSGGNVWCVGRVRNTGSYTPGTSEAGVNVWVAGIAYQQPNPPSNPAVTRVSDTRADLTWQGNYTGMDGLYPWTGVYVDRATDGGSWTNIAQLNWDAVNYTDNSISSNHQYQYRLRSYGPGGTSNPAVCSGSPIYTTPAAPASVSLSKVSDTTVSVSITGAAPYASSYDVEYRLNGGDWESAGTTTSWPFQHNPGGGTAQYRVMACRGDLKSSWTESGTIATITPPLAPTVTVGDGSGVFPTGQPIPVTWVPNHPDGSDQSQAQVEVTIGDGEPQVTDISGSATSYTISAQDDATTVKVRVRTHGLDPDWGAWSSVQSVTVAVAPSGFFSFPDYDDYVIDALPIPVQWSISDPTGVAAQTLTLNDDDGNRLWSQSLSPSVRSFQLTEAQYGFVNLSGYSLVLNATMGSGLRLTINRTFRTDWAGPSVPTVSMSVGDDLSASIVVTDGNDGQSPAAVSFSVSRVMPDGSQWLVATGLLNAQTARDPLPPLNIDYHYLVTAYAETGATTQLNYLAHIRTPYEALNFGPSATDALVMGLDKTGSESTDHEGDLYSFALGGTVNLPIFYPKSSATSEIKRSYRVLSREEYGKVRSMSDRYAEGWLRDSFGNRFYGVVSLETSWEMRGGPMYFDVDLTLNREPFVEVGDELVL